MSEGNNKNSLYLIIGLLIAAVLVLGYFFMQEKDKDGVSIEINENGLQIEEK